MSWTKPAGKMQTDEMVNRMKCRKSFNLKCEKSSHIMDKVSDETYIHTFATHQKKSQNIMKELAFKPKMISIDQLCKEMKITVHIIKTR